MRKLGFPVCFCQRQSERAASAITNRPIGTIKPTSSASGMNSAGNTSPPGVRQRTSASKPAMAPSASCTIGW